MKFEEILRALRDSNVDFIIVGGVAARIHGAARLTDDLDVVYGRSRENIERLARALAPFHPYLRGAPPGLPFRFDPSTIRGGLNFTLVTDAGPLDCLGEISGVGGYEAIASRSEPVEVFGVACRVIDLDALILAKRAAGRPKDFEALAELEAIREEKSEE
ncbi:MAG TPA: hypothetical protein VF701_17080 [Thermoanaerobaculia bacterium]